jgi:hypothetical protein
MRSAYEGPKVVKDCPCCGFEATVKDAGLLCSMWVVVCDRCGLSMGARDQDALTKHQAITLWNSRTG